MYVIYVDEADLVAKNEFIVFAAVFFPADQVLQLHNGIRHIREKYGYKPDDPLKFSPGTMPEHIGRKNHSKAKNEVLDLLAERGCKTCCYIVPTSIAANQAASTRIEFAINTLLPKFDIFLAENGNSAGVVKFDRTDDFKQEKHFKTIMKHGISYADQCFSLSNIISIDTTRDGLSHLSSATDIVVGAFRFAINEPEKDKVGRLLVRSLSRTLWHSKLENGTLSIRERGLIIRPANIARADYKADVEAFTDRLFNYLNE